MEIYNKTRSRWGDNTKWLSTSSHDGDLYTVIYQSVLFSLGKTLSHTDTQIKNEEGSGEQ